MMRESNLSGVPFVIDKYMPPYSFSFHDQIIYADCMETVEAILHCSFLKSCGIMTEPPRYIPLPDMGSWFRL